MSFVAPLVPAAWPPPTPPADSSKTLDAERLGEAIAELAARLHAATYELLGLIRQFDAAAGWSSTGFLSCAHWLHWRTGIELGAAREKVRVSRALVDLPRIGAAMQRGELSYSKVRALTRVATPECEERLLAVAQAATAAQVEQIVRAWRRVDRQQAAQLTEQRHLSRYVTTCVDDDGMVVIRGRLTPEIGAMLQRALEAAADRLFLEARNAANGNTLAEEVTAGQFLRHLLANRDGARSRCLHGLARIAAAAVLHAARHGGKGCRRAGAALRGGRRLPGNRLLPPGGRARSSRRVCPGRGSRSRHHG